MKIVIDTNVVVSAVLRDRNPETVILFVIGNPEFKWVASREIIEEYIGVLSRERFAPYRRKFWTNGRISSMKS